MGIDGDIARRADQEGLGIVDRMGGTITLQPQISGVKHILRILRIHPAAELAQQPLPISLVVESVRHEFLSRTRICEEPTGGGGCQAAAPLPG